LFKDSLLLLLLLLSPYVAHHCCRHDWHCGGGMATAAPELQSSIKKWRMINNNDTWRPLLVFARASLLTSHLILKVPRCCDSNTEFSRFKKSFVMRALFLTMFFDHRF
jgi:hypothetical protein